MSQHKIEMLAAAYRQEQQQVRLQQNRLSKIRSGKLESPTKRALDKATNELGNKLLRRYS